MKYLILGIDDLPINGRYTDPRKIVYSAVLVAQKAVMSAMGFV